MTGWHPSQHRLLAPPSVIVKICGLRRPDHAVAAAIAGADWLGLVFAPSKRRVTIDEARAVADAVRTRIARPPLLAGLFVNEAPTVILATARAVGLDLIQLSGDEPVELAEQLPLPVLKTVRFSGTPAEQAWIAHAQRSFLHHAGHVERFARTPPPVLLLADAHVPGAYGGTGKTADWRQAAELATRTPLLLAGGLHPGNVAQAIAVVRPLGVDVSSGVETDGVKDPAKIEAFIAAARAV